MRTRIGCLAVLASVMGMAAEAVAHGENYEGAPGNRGLSLRFPASDHIIGSASDDYVEGDGGLGDIIEAGKGHDRVFEMRGDDVISGGADSDILFGGEAANDARYEGERKVA